MLDTLKGDESAEREAAELASSDVVELAQRLGRTRKPQTVGNCLSRLSAVLSVARSAWGMEVDRDVMRPTRMVVIPASS